MAARRGAVVALTRNGARTGERLARNLPGTILYLPERLKTDLTFPGGAVEYFKEWQALVKDLFFEKSYLVFVSAVAIAVRSLSPHLHDKYRDPAVVVVDEGGQYAVSLLSGHRGGGNELAREVAQTLGGEPVITTATDRAGKKYPPDQLAAEMKASLEPSSLVKEFNRRLAEGEQLNLYSPFALADGIKKEYRWQGWPGAPGNSKGALPGPCLETCFDEPALLVSPYRVKPAQQKVLQIKPPCLVVGIGCRKEVPLQAVREAITEAFRRHGVDLACIGSLSIVDFKGKEEAIRAFCREQEIPLKIYSVEEIAALKGTYRESTRVLQELGVGGVCEPAAKLAAEGGSTLLPKEKHGPVTVSVALEKSWWWDWAPGTGTF